MWKFNSATTLGSVGMFRVYSRYMLYLVFHGFYECCVSMVSHMKVSLDDDDDDTRSEGVRFVVLTN